MPLLSSHPACGHYDPNWVKWKAEGHLCTGFGDSPGCKHCGQDENAHYRAKLAKEAQCKGFVPSHGFGNARKCLRCGEELARHQVQVQ